MRRVLGVAWFRFRSTFRNAVGAYLALVLLIGLLGGLSLVAVAGARRTQSSYPAFLASTNPSDLVVQPYGIGRIGPEFARGVARLPHVKRVGQVEFANAWLSNAAGRFEPVPASVKLLGSIDGRYFGADRAVAVKGRMAVPGRADEMIMTADAASELHVRVGDVLRFEFRGVKRQSDPPYSVSVGGASLLTTNVRLVGIVVLNSTLVQDDADRYPAPAVFTPALMRRVNRRCSPTCSLHSPLLGIQVDDQRNVLAVQHEIEAALPGLNFPLTELTSIVEAKALRAVRPTSIALGVFGAIAALATLVLAAQMIGRQLRVAADDLDILRALGATPAMRSIDGLGGILASIVLGAVVAVAVAVGLSPLAPIGPVQRVYPARGFGFDWTVLALGSAILIVGLSCFAIAVSYRRTTARSTRRGRTGGSRIARAASATGLPISVVAGIRLALEPGRSRSAVPVRSTIVTTALAVAIAVSTLVFGASLNTLVSHPALYGWNWNYALQAANNGPIPPNTRTALDRAPEIAAWAGVIQVPLVHIDNLLVPAFTIVPDSRPTPSMLTGHAIDGPDQLVVGTATLARLHKRVGDTAIVSLGRPQDAPLRTEPAPFRIVGTATFPTIGFIGVQNTSMATGASVANTNQPRNTGLKRLRTALYGDLNGPTLALVQLRPGVSAATGREILQRITNRANTNSTQTANGWTLSLLAAQRPAEIATYRSIGATPTLLAVTLAAGATVALALALLTSVRRRRRDLALLKTLGFTHRQLLTAVVSQASLTAIIGIAIGIPIGIITGRQLWTVFSTSISAVPQPTVPMTAIALVAIATLLIAATIAAIPGRQAARTPITLLLRAE